MGRKAITTMAMFTLLALTLVSVQAVSAKTLKFVQVIDYKDWGVVGPLHPETTYYWKGLLDGSIKGTCYFWETDKNYVVGKVEHFFEDFYIELDSGGWISGYDDGVWNFATFKYRAQGRVTAASPGLESFIGCKFFEEGVTTDPNLGLPIHGVATGFIGP